MEVMCYLFNVTISNNLESLVLITRLLILRPSCKMPLRNKYADGRDKSRRQPVGREIQTGNPSHGINVCGGEVVAGSPEMLRDVAMATTFWLSIGYNFGCVIASGTIFDSGSRFSGVKLCDEVTAELRGSKRRCHGNQVWD